MADQDYIKARHKLIPVAMKIVSDAFGIKLSSGHNPNSGEVGKSFIFSSYHGDGAKVSTAFLATMDQLYAESQQEVTA